MKGIKAIVKFLGALLIGVLVLGGLILGLTRTFSKEVYPTFLGYGAAIVISGSMEPTVSVNDLVITHKKNSYKQDDIILFQRDTSLVTHRIVKSDKQNYLTKGDANNTEDDWLKSEQVLGKVIVIVPAIGFIQEFFATKLGTAGLFLLIFFAGLLLFDNGKPQKRKRRRRKR